MKLVLISLVTLHLKNKLDTPCKIIQKFENNIRTKQKKKKKGKCYSYTQMKNRRVTDKGVSRTHLNI